MSSSELQEQFDVAVALKETGLVVFHGRRQADQPVPIDYLVVGPAAVYVVNQLSAGGGRVWASENSLRIGGRNESDVLRALTDAGKRVRKVLKGAGVRLPTVPLLCLTAPGGPDCQPSREVLVCSGATLMRMVFAPGRVKDPAEAKRIGEVLSQGFLFN